MSLQIRPPHPALSSFVQSYWFLHYKIPNAATLPPLAATPVPEQALYFYPRQKGVATTLDGQKLETPAVMIAGQGTKCVNYYLPEDYMMFKIVFHTTGFYRLFGTPMTLFVDNYTDAEAVLGSTITVVKRRIEAVADFNSMVSIANSFLLERINQAKYDELQIDKALKTLSWQNMSLDNLAREACLSTRQFEAIF